MNPTQHPYLPAPYLYLPRVASRVRRTGLRATVAYFKNRGYTLDQALYLFAGRGCTSPRINGPACYLAPRV